MLILNAITDEIEVILTSNITTNQLRCVASYRDATTTTFTGGRIVTNTNNTTAVNIVTSPAASTERIVDFISIFNSDTVSSEVTIRFVGAEGTFILVKATLSADERLEYTDGHGFNVYTRSGAIKMAETNTGTQVAQLASDVINSNAVANTIADVSGLSFPVVAGFKYAFSATIAYTAAAGTTGSRWSCNGPAITFLSYYSTYTLTTTTVTNNQGLSTFDVPAASNATSITGSNTAIVEGVFQPSANGNFVIRFASEVSNSAITAKAGSTLRYWVI